MLAATSSLSGTFLTCSNDVQIHCGRARGLMHRVKADQAQGFGQALPLPQVGQRRRQNESLDHVEVLGLLLAVGDKIFHETLSMKAPNVLSEFWPGGKVDREIGIRGLAGLGIQMVRP